MTGPSERLRMMARELRRLCDAIERGDHGDMTPARRAAMLGHLDHTANELDLMAEVDDVLGDGGPGGRP